jgi:lycopene beta-cyclase
VSTESGSRKPDQISCLQQHFIGWFIKAKNRLTPEQATFMDFSVEKKGNTRFMYVSLQN